MMEIYRISKATYPEIDGYGGMIYPGRWHEKGNKVVYTSEHRSLAAFEALVHLSRPFLLKSNFVLISIEVPDDALILEVPQEILVSGWDGYEFFPDIQAFGTRFLREKTHLLMKVPSAIIKQEYNYILNPAHNQFHACKVVDISPFTFDERLE
jgi:RES domain-containing protein